MRRHTFHFYQIYSFYSQTIAEYKIYFLFNKKKHYLIVLGPKIFVQGTSLQLDRLIPIIQTQVVYYLRVLPLQTDTDLGSYGISHIPISLRGVVVLEPKATFVLIGGQDSRQMTNLNINLT